MAMRVPVPVGLYGVFHAKGGGSDAQVRVMREKQRPELCPFCLRSWRRLLGEGLDAFLGCSLLWWMLNVHVDAVSGRA